MYPWDEQEETFLPEIEEALRTYPTEAPPAELYSTVMQQIDLAQKASQKPLLCSWFDIAMTLFAGSMALLVMILIKLSTIFPQAKLTLGWLCQWMALPPILYSLLGALLITSASLLLITFAFLFNQE